MLGLEMFGFREIWSPLLLVFMLLIAGLYLAFTGSKRHLIKGSEPVANGRKATFLLGLVLLYFAQGGPLSLLGHLMFSAHMIAMAISYIVAPPLILLGIPAWMIRPLLSNPRVNSAFAKVTNPILCLLLFNVLFSLYHMPAVHDYVMTNYWIHAIYYIALLITSMMMWWVVLSPIPEMDRLSDVKKMGFIFASGALLTPACALIIFASDPLYGTYTNPKIWAEALGWCVPAGADFVLSNFDGPQTFAILAPLDDQQFGGVVMKLIQEVMYGSVLAIVFYRWFRKENPSGKIDPIEPVS